MPEESTNDASPYEQLALGALLEITTAASIGAYAGHVDEGDGAVSVLFDSAMPGYPDWKWTVSIAHVTGEEPSVLEAELMPAEGALLAPEWVPWSDRLAEYKAAQAAEGVIDDDDSADGSIGTDDDESDESDDDLDDESDDDDLDDDSLDDEDDENELDDHILDDDDVLGSDVLHGGDLDGVDIDDVDDVDDDDDDDDDFDVDPGDDEDDDLDGDDREGDDSDGDERDKSY